MEKTTEALRTLSSTKFLIVKKHIFIGILLPAMIALTMVSCEKEPGTGGKSSIYGKVLVKEYNSTFTTLQETYYGPGIWVYIIYGDNRDYSDRIQTGFNGTWEFKYLRPGTYKVYALSKDSTLQTNALIPVIREAEIPTKKQDIEVPDLVIFN
jgi:hypothetical protein